MVGGQRVFCPPPLSNYKGRPGPSLSTPMQQKYRLGIINSFTGSKPRLCFCSCSKHMARIRIFLQVLKHDIYIINLVLVSVKLTANAYLVLKTCYTKNYEIIFHVSQ